MDRNYFYFLEYSDGVKDSREQFPLLPIEENLTIVDELGYEHLKHPHTGEYIFMTTDFLVTSEQDRELFDFARTIKAKDELLNRRIVEKMVENLMKKEVIKANNCHLIKEKRQG